MSSSPPFSPRVRIAPTVSKTTELAGVVLALTALTLIALHQQAGDLYAVPDRGDPVFSMWRMGWVAHQIVTSPRHLFDANIFYPLRATLTYSDAMLLPALTGAPLLWAGVHPVVAYNLVFLSGFVLCGLAAYLLVRGLGWGRLAAWIAAVAFALCPFRIDHLSHLELQMAQWMPIALLGVHGLLSSGKPWYGVGAGVRAGGAVVLVDVLRSLPDALCRRVRGCARRHREAAGAPRGVRSRGGGS